MTPTEARALADRHVAKYAAAEQRCLALAEVQPTPRWDEERDALFLAARVLRALADGAVLCEVLEEASPVAYIPLDPQP